MSDYYRNQNQNPYSSADGMAPWDAPQDGLESFQASGVPLWQQPAGTFQDPLTQDASMMLGGAQPDFRTQGDDAPTRVARPVTQQMVNRRTTVERSRVSAEGAAQSTPPKAEAPAAPERRRRSRVAERAQEEALKAPAQQDYDLFQAGDSEAAAPQRRAAVPGGRYTGARTATPVGTAARRPAAQAGEGGTRQPRQPQPRQQAARPAAEAQRAREEEPVRQQPRRPAAQRPAAAQGQRPQPARHNAPMRQEPQDAPMPRRQAAKPAARPADEPYRRPSASVERPRYEFEDEPETVEEEPRRRGGVLVPLLVALMVLGALLAGLCLPKWESMGGSIGKLLAPVKGSVVGAFNSVKNMIVPEEEPLKSFSAAATDLTAPTQVIFAVQTTKNVAGIRIVNDFGDIVYEGEYNADMEATGEVISNSNVLLWNPSASVTEGYAGSYTVYAIKKDGTQSEGLAAAAPVNIAEPKPSEPPVQGFACDTAISAVPARIAFTLTTSTDVTAVRVVDSYNAPVAEMYLGDPAGESGSVEDNGDSRVWTLYAGVEAPYAGEYTAQYQAQGELNFTPSGFDVEVQLGGEPLEATEAPTAVPVETQAPTLAPTPTPTATPSPTPTPEPTPEPTPTPVPTTSPLPALSAAAGTGADPSELELKATVYSGSKTVSSYNRSRAINLLNAFTTKVGGSDYAGWRQAGVLTFRSGPLRQNAAYGTVDVQKGALTEVWSQPIGFMKTNDGAAYGVAAPGQPVIVKWPTELRQRMGLKDEMKDVTALKEVIVAGQDGNVSFYNLLTGEATRDPIELGAPSRGGLSVATNGTPVLGVGQYNSRLANKTVKNGYHIIDLVNNKKLRLIAGDGKDKNSNYSGFTGSALFDSATGTMIVGGQNGVLYTAELGPVKNSYNYQANSISLGTDTQAYKTQIKDQKKTNTNIDASVAMYNNYVYYADQQGVVQCVDVNTLTPVWAVDTGDNVDATPALDVENGSDVALYTGNTIMNETKGVCTIRRLNALTGEQVWAYEVPELAYVKKQEVGCYASPVVGKGDIEALVIFTVTNGKEAARVIALNKADGSVAWQTSLESPSLSSPVAVYNEDGKAWLIQAESNGKIHLMDPTDGSILDTLTLAPIEDPEGELAIEGSPAVYGNLLVIGTTGKNAGGVYCIKIE